MCAIVVIREPASAEAFAALALGVLLERLASSTEDLVLLRAQLQDSASSPEPIAQQIDLAKTCADLEQHGWLFGLFSRELGSDVLFQRRERRGLLSALELVREILARDGVEISISKLPDLDTADERCATICAVVARCVHAAYSVNAAHETAPWSFAQCDGAISLCFAAPVSGGLQRALVDAAKRINGSRLVRDASGMQLVLPKNCAVWP